MAKRFEKCSRQHFQTEVQPERNVRDQRENIREYWRASEGRRNV